MAGKRIMHDIHAQIQVIASGIGIFLLKRENPPQILWNQFLLPKAVMLDAVCQQSSCNATSVFDVIHAL